MRHFKMGLIALAGIMMAVGVSAATLTVDSVTGAWTNVQPGTTTGLTGEGTDSVRWGTSTGSGQSGYDFDAEIVPFAPSTTPFDIGTLTHLNFPIAANPTPASITGADLDLTVTGTVDVGGAVQPFSIGGVYSFGHFETANNDSPCAAGGTSPCPDLVTYLGAVEFSDSFTLGDEEIFLSVEGFSDGFTFLTAEGQASSSTLVAAFTATPTTLTTVPLPAGGILLLSALGALGLARRRRHS